MQFKSGCHLQKKQPQTYAFAAFEAVYFASESLFGALMMDIQTIYALLYLEINLVAVFLIGIIRHRTAGLSKMVAQRNFSMAINAQTVFFLSDTFYVMMLYGLIPYSPAAAMAAMRSSFWRTRTMPPRSTRCATTSTRPGPIRPCR